MSHSLLNPVIGFLFVLIMMPILDAPQQGDKPLPVPAVGLGKEVDWEGIYKCVGITEKKTEYEGVVQMEKVSVGYVVSTVSGATHTIGIGVVRGEDLVISWLVRGTQTFGQTTLRKTAKGFEGTYITFPGVNRPLREDWIQLVEAK